MTIDNSQYVVLGVFVAYVVLVSLVWKVNKVDYDTIAASTENVRKGIVVPIGLGAVLLALATTALDAWHDVLFDDGRSGPTWALLVPVVFGLVALANIATIDVRSPNATILPGLALGTLLVGFSEEVLTRGLLVVGFREAGWSEITVYLVATVAFALLHGINAFFGQSMKATVTQIVVAFVAGTALYVTRLTTGTLLAGIVLHAMWDFGALGVVSTGRQQRTFAAVTALVTYGLGMIAIWFVV